MFMPSLFFVDAVSSFVSVTRDIRQCELKPASGKSGKKYSNKKGFIRIYYQGRAGGTLYHLLNMGVNKKNRDPSFLWASLGKCGKGVVKTKCPRNFGV